MALSKTLRSCFRARLTAVRPQIFRQTQISLRRGYSSGHESAKAGGDAVWAAGAIAVTVPATWWILSNAPETHHNDHHVEEHGEQGLNEKEPEEEDESADKPEEASDGADAKSDDSETSDNSGSDNDNKEAKISEKSDDEEDGESSEKNTKKSIPDAKGGNKKRIESNQAIKAGETDAEAAASKPVGDKNSQTSKQEGLTNTDTKHSTDITNNPEKSKKGEGAPETAKVKGTVDPKRPQV
ncbi:hypothetical protein BUE80_DR005866 [Diplocarpon rosae]|nr:hypothetical protein BUE80_DR005866 [Diplocarpon rosae]